MNKPDKDFLILMISTAFQFILGILSTRVVTSLLTPYEMGRIAIITASVFWVNFLLGPAFTYTQRHLFEWDSRGMARKYITHYFLYLLIVSVAECVVLILLNHTIGIGMNIANYWLVVLVMGLVFCSGIYNIFVGWLNMFKRRKLYAFFLNLATCLSLCFSSLSVFFISGFAENWLSGQIISQILVLFFSGMVFLRVLKSPHALDTCKEATPLEKPKLLSLVFNFALPMSISSLLLWSQQNAYRFVLAKVSSLEVVGFFTVGFGLGMNLLDRFNGLFNQFYDPIFYKETTTNEISKKIAAWNKYAYYLMPATFVLSIYIICGAPFIAKIIMGAKFYYVSRNIIIWGVLSQLALIFYSAYSMVGVVQLNTKGYILPNICGLIVLMCGLILLSRWNPYVGAGISLSAASLAIFVMGRWKMVKLLPVALPWRRLFFSFVLTLPLIIFFVIIRFLYSDPSVFQSIFILTLSGVFATFIQLLLIKKDIAMPIRLDYVNQIIKRVGAGEIRAD